MNKYLLLMRHAKSDWNDAGLTDKQRPLNSRGRASAPRMADWLARQNHTPDLVLCSSAVRTQQTLELMTEYWLSRNENNSAFAIPQIHIDDSLYLASYSQLVSFAREFVAGVSTLGGPKPNRVMVLAHNPGMENLASQLSDRQIEMPTGAIAVFESGDPAGDWPPDWGDGKMWKLRELAKPRELDAEIN